MFEAKMKFQTELQLANEKGEGMQDKTTDGTSVSGHELPAKLPKLQIARFNGTYEDWPRFWNQFIEIIDKATMPGVTKFAYLKSFLDQKVKHSLKDCHFRAKVTTEPSPYCSISIGKIQRSSRPTPNKYLTCLSYLTRTLTEFTIFVTN